MGTFRFSSPLVDPTPPTPNYGVQAVVATVSVVATLVAGLGAAIYAAEASCGLGYNCVALWQHPRDDSCFCVEFPLSIE